MKKKIGKTYFYNPIDEKSKYIVEAMKCMNICVVDFDVVIKKDDDYQYFYSKAVEDIKEKMKC